MLVSVLASDIPGEVRCTNQEHLKEIKQIPHIKKKQKQKQNHVHKIYL